MAKVAKKSASSVKKSGAIKKVVAKKTEKQKKTAVKVTSSSSKKKTETKKVVPAVKKAVAKKTIGKSKVATKKTVSKPTPIKKVEAKTSSKSSKTIAKPIVKSKVPAKAVVKKVSTKAKVASKDKTVVKSVSKPAKKAEISKKAKVIESKPATVVAAVIPVSKTAAKPRRAKKKDDDDDDEEVVVFRKPAKVAKSPSAKKASSKYVSEELTLEGPAPTRVGPIVMSSDEKMKLKKTLLHKCIDIQKNNVGLAKKAMEDALSSANEEKVTEELSDSFRESMHATRDMYARQAQEGVNSLGLLNRIMVQEHDKVKFGSVVFTNFQNYFISTSLGELKVEDKTFQTVSTLSPLFQILADKRKGDTFMFLDRLYTVLEVF
jgi:hypothetical protein